MLVKTEPLRTTAGPNLGAEKQPKSDFNMMGLPRANASLRLVVRKLSECWDPLRPRPFGSTRGAEDPVGCCSSEANRAAGQQF